MLLSTLRVLRSHKRQAIPKLGAVELHAPFRGRPVLRDEGLTPARLKALAALCPTGAISTTPFTLDMGRCLFCGECAVQFPDHIAFTSDYRTASTTREGLVVSASGNAPQLFGPHNQPEATVKTRPETKRLFRQALKLRQLSAGGDNSCEMELNAAGNVNFDMRRLGVEFVASPRHADGLVITGPLTRNMAREAEITLSAIPEPRLIIAVGIDAISGGLFDGAPAVDRSFFERHTPDLYVPGNPAHPMSFITGIQELIAPLPEAKRQPEAGQEAEND